jgi:hypothetical protein
MLGLQLYRIVSSSIRISIINAMREQYDMLWEQNNILREQDNLLWEQNSMSWEQNILIN